MSLTKIIVTGAGEAMKTAWQKVNTFIDDYEAGTNAAAHNTKHQNGGADEIVVTGLSGLLADDQHVLDAEVLAVAAAKGANADITSMTGLDNDGIPYAKVYGAGNLYFPDYNEADQGLAGNGESVKAYIDAIGADSATLCFRHNSGSATTTYTFSTDETIPSNIKVVIEKGAILSIAGANTLTINGAFDAGLYQVFSGDGTVGFGDNIDEVFLEWWVINTTPGTTPMTSAFTSALATGKNVKLLDTTYATTGGHSLATTGQKIIGAGREVSIIKKLSGTNEVISTPFGTENVCIQDVTFYGNDLGGSQIIWRGHRSTLKNIYIKNQGGTDFAIHFSGMNLSTVDNITTYNCYGGFEINNLTDPSYAGGVPSYSAMYTTFSNCKLDATGAGSCLKIDGSQGQILNFVGLVIYNNLGNDLTSPAISIEGTNCSNITFLNLAGEIISNTYLVHINSIYDYNINFIGGKLTHNSYNASAIVRVAGAQGTNINGMLFGADYNTDGDAVAIQITSTSRSTTIENCSALMLYDYTFISASAAQYVVSKNNRRVRTDTYTGVGTNVWSGANYIEIDNSDMLETGIDSATNLQMRNVADRHDINCAGQITVADEGYYDLYGDGGFTSPGIDFAGFISISTGPITNGSENNAALLYIQTGYADSSSKCTPISIGSNVEVDLLNDNTAALARTTDGKLGVQVTGGNSTMRSISIWNRTGASVTLSIHVNRMI
jgi:hypothetical protein